MEAIEQQLKEKERDNKGIISDETIDVYQLLVVIEL